MLYNKLYRKSTKDRIDKSWGLNTRAFYIWSKWLFTEPYCAAADPNDADV